MIKTTVFSKSFKSTLFFLDTNMDYIDKKPKSGLTVYMEEIGKPEYDPLTPNQEVLLAQRIKQGDQEAFFELCKHNLRFVISAAKMFNNYSDKMSLEDRIQAGNMGLFEAAKRYDETRGFKFITYAVWWIKQRIRSAYFEKYKYVVKLPMNRQALIGKIKENHETFLAVNEGREPTSYQLIDLMKQTSGKLPNFCNVDDIYLDGVHIEKSLDQNLWEDDKRQVYNKIPDTSSLDPEKYSMQTNGHEDIEKLLSLLDKRSRTIVCMYLGIDGYQKLTLEEIGTEFGFTRERARQIKRDALITLRHPAHKELVMNLVD